MRLRQRLITGLVTLLPLIVTLYLLGWVYTYSGAYIQAFLRLFGLEVPRAYQPLLPFVGLPPIVRDIYKAVQQIAHTLFGPQEVKFSRAALIEYPRRGVYALCFVVQSVGGRLPPLPEGYTAVLVPTSPVPASGMVVLVPSEEVLPLEISVEEALKYVVSAGFLLPEKPQGPLTSLPQRAERPS